MTTNTIISALKLRAGRSVRLFDAIRHRGSLLRSRKSLSRLDDHLLRDIGLTRDEAAAEAARAAWDVPPHWRG